ncbi:MAG TPA: hypothetical protein VGP82_10455 [Ktedonobacterales bacterium]|nr:hypothetical protein [Ktedonobacterales bacterium]
MATAGHLYQSGEQGLRTLVEKYGDRRVFARVPSCRPEASPRETKAYALTSQGVEVSLWSGREAAISLSIRHSMLG